MVIGENIVYYWWIKQLPRAFVLVFVHNHTWQLLFVTDANVNTEIEITCKNVIEDAVHEDYESDHDLWLLNVKAFISTEPLQKVPNCLCKCM